MIGARCSLQDRFAKKFLTLKNEDLVYSTRQHWSRLIPIFVLNILLLIVVIFLSIFSSFLFPNFSFTFLIILILILTIALEILIKQMVEWFFHFYIVTTRKIIEVTYRPLYSKIISEVLLDQVRCTEVDVSGLGFFNEIFNVGTVLITFDRPTNEKIFTIENIKRPRNIAMQLGDVFGMQKAKDPVSPSFTSV